MIQNVTLKNGFGVVDAAGNFIGGVNKRLDKNRNLRIAFEGFFAFLPYLVLPFSAPFAFFFALLILFFMSFFNPSRFCRVTLSLCAIFGGSVTYADAGTFDRDLLNYYNTFLELWYGNIDALFSYGKGVEFMAPLYWLFLGQILGNIDMLHFAMIQSVSCSVLLLIWFEKYGYKEIECGNVALCLFLVFLCFDYFTPIWITRQYYSSIFVLFALSQKNMIYRLIFVFIATCFHLSGIIFFILFYLLRNYKKIGLSVIGILCFFIASGLLLNVLLSSAHILPDVIAHKLVFYDRQTYHAYIGTTNFLTILYLLVLIMFIFLYRHKVPDKWKYIILGMAILYLSTSSFHTEMSGRVGFMIFTVLLGISFFVTFSQNSLLLYLLCYIIFFYKIGIFFKKAIFTTHEMLQDNIIKTTYHYGISGDWFYFLF